MKLTLEEFEGDLFVRVEEARIDAAAALAFRDAMRAQVDRGHPRLVLVLDQVDFVDSSGLGAIVGTMKLMGADRRFELAGLTPLVTKVFRLTRLDGVITIHSDADVARAGAAHAG